MSRKLKIKELMIISRILEDVNFKHYFEYLSSSKTKTNSFSDIFVFIVQNMHKSEENICELIKSYKKVSQEEIDSYDIDDFLTIFKDILSGGIPKVITDLINMESLKKKWNEIKATIQKLDFEKIEISQKNKEKLKVL